MAVASVALVALAVAVAGNALSDGRSTRGVTPAGTGGGSTDDHDSGDVRADFLELFEASRLGSWQAVFAYERLVGDEAGLSGTIVEVNVPPERVVTGIGGFTYQRDSEVISCVDLEGVRECRPPEPAASTRCFEVRFADHEIRGRTETCFDDAGIPLRFVLERQRAVETRTATSFAAANPGDVDEAIADYPVDAPMSDSGSLPTLT